MITGSRSRKLGKPAKRCIFCGGGNLSDTHVFPHWLDRLIPGPNFKAQEYVSPASEGGVKRVEIRRGQGGLFSQAPRLACKICNEGWMNSLEVALEKFRVPLFTGSPVTLN